VCRQYDREKQGKDQREHTSDGQFVAGVHNAMLHRYVHNNPPAEYGSTYYFVD
jgi:hypothetical protein